MRSQILDVPLLLHIRRVVKRIEEQYIINNNKFQ